MKVVRFISNGDNSYRTGQDVPVIGDYVDLKSFRDVVELLEYAAGNVPSHDVGFHKEVEDILKELEG